MILLSACAAFQKYDLLSARDRRSVVEEAIQEVRAQKNGSANDSSSAHSQRVPQQAERTACDTYPTGSQPVHERQRPIQKVSSMTNLVGAGSLDEPCNRASYSEQPSAVAGDDGRRGQESNARMSKKHRGLRLMTPEGSGAQLLSSADAAGASAEPPRAVPAAVSQLQQDPRTTHASSASRGLPGSGSLQAPSGQPGAVLVGEDEEFSVNSGELSQDSLQSCPKTDTSASHEQHRPGRSRR